MTSLTGSDFKRYFHLVSLYLLYFGAFLYFAGPAIGRPVFELFLITGALSLIWHLPRIWRNPVVLLLGASILIQIASWMYCQQNFAQYAASNPDLKRLGHLFLFLPVAWVLGANNRSPWVLAVLFFAGLCITPFSMGNGVSDFFDGQRSDFGYRNAQHVAMVFAVSLVALVVFRKRVLDGFPSAKTWVSAVLAAAIIYAVLIVAIANTRGVFLGLAAGVLVAGAGMLLKNKKPKKRDVLVTAVLAIVMAMSLSLTSNPVSNWLREVDTVKSLVSGDVSNIPNDTSSGIRIHTWVEGWKWFGQSPWIGWGQNGKNMAIKESTALPEAIRNEFGHLHNSYLETLVNNGLLGLSLILALHAWVGTTVIKGCRRRGIKDVQVFTTVVGVLWLIANCFESYMFYRSGVMMFGIVSASLLTASGYDFGLSSPVARDAHES